MKKTTCQLLSILFVSLFFAACSRPVAYVQKSPRETFAAARSSVVASAELPGATALAVENEPVANSLTTPAALDQIDALVRRDNKLSTDKTVQKRLNKVRTMLNASASVAPLAPVSNTRKANLLERTMIKKIDRQITKKFSPQKPAINSGTLATGAVLVIVGLLLVLLTSGTAFTVGVIVLIVGVVALLLGLL